MTDEILIRDLGLACYEPVFEAMRSYTMERDAASPDELWCVQHPPVYTLGKTAKLLGVPPRDGTQVVQTDRGGDITYHAPGQLVVYPLVNLTRRHIFVREFVKIIEDSIIETLGEFSIEAFLHEGAPGVYVAMPGGSGEFAGQAKISSLGIKVSRGSSYHGLSLNVAMDLSGFAKIDPCGYKALRMTDMRSLGCNATVEETAGVLCARLAHKLKNHV